MNVNGPVKALLLSVAADPMPAIATLQRLTPEFLCFFLPESVKSLVESDIHPRLSSMPQRWDWIFTEHPESFALSHRALAENLPPLLKTWQIAPGELVVDLTSASSGMAAAMALVTLPFTSNVITLKPGDGEQGRDGNEGERDGRACTWSESNPWDEHAVWLRHEAGNLFNQGAYKGASQAFRNLERRVSGGGKPLYRALADLAQGYTLWDQLQYRQAWDKLKSAHKSLTLASAWGGPIGIDTTLRRVKEHIQFLEHIVLDPQEIKSKIALDLLAQAKRRADRDRDGEFATRILFRALEAFAQTKLFIHYHIKSWDVRLEQLPQALQETCRTCYLNDMDGKYRLPLHAQFRVLAGLGDTMGQTFLGQWATMKTLIDAADHAILGEGFEPIKIERFHQLYELVLKLSSVHSSDLPAFPTLNL